jgi:glycine/D-amino acid oxidase-like deaminating enzyme
MGRNRYDVIVIGGGLYGCVLALQARQRGRRVTLLEKESDLLRRASYANQARIHQGYHYPRSLLTALRSRVNFPRFAVDFAECVHAGFDKYYAVARHQSKVTADQFRLFCQRIGAPLAPAPRAVKELFDPVLIEEVFRVTEHAFDAVRLRQLLWRALHEAGVDVRLHARVLRIEPYGGELSVLVRGPGSEGSYLAGLVCNCTYSQINQVLQDSGLPLVPLKHELTEMALVRVPGEFQGLGITVMDGAFFSLMPFPPRGLHSLSHVRYTPHQYWRRVPRCA